MIGSFTKRKRWLLAGTGAAVSLVAMACGSDGTAPAANDGDGTPTGELPPASNQTLSGYDSVRQSLQADGAVVVRGEQAAEGIFKNPYTEVLVNGETIQVYEFADAGAAVAASATVSSDGTIISQEAGAPAIAIDFQNAPHYFRHDNVIVVYTGDDAGTVEILREKLGEEFAGDKGEVGGEPGGAPAPQVDYDTVSAPAPIDGVKVGIDPNNPNSYVLNVVSGLPGGCASFEDWSLERAEDGKFVLEVTNRVPSPDELVACTAIYGMMDLVIPVGTVGEELNACEVYTVSFKVGADDKLESVRFQAVADNVRCEDPGLAEGEDTYSSGNGVQPGRPGDGDRPGNGGEDFPQTIISDVQALLLTLERLGIKAEWGTGDEQGSGLLGFDSDIITINGQRVDVWVFSPGESAWKVAGGISQDGYSINVPGAPIAEVMWADAPHFYLFGNAIVLYVGNDEEIIAALDASAVKFAGPGSRPLDEPIPVEPDGGIGSTPDDRPIPVEPDGGIGDGAGLPADPDAPVSSDDPIAGEPDPDADWDTVLEPAPIIEVGEVAVAESFPVQYFLSVRTAQPDGCHKDAGYEVKIEGTTVHVTVNNSVPENLAVVMCTMIYGETEQSVKLGNGDDFESGVEYTVVVNGEVERTFTAQ